MSKMIVSVPSIPTEMLKKIIGDRLEHEFKKNPLVKNMITVTYED